MRFAQFAPLGDSTEGLSGGTTEHVEGSLLTKHQFWAVTTWALVVISLAGVNTHSFRIGAASKVAAMGYLLLVTKQLGHWHSALYHSYVCSLHKF